jgi:hypothetical protein
MTARQAREVITDQAGCALVRTFALSDDEIIAPLGPVALSDHHRLG